MSRDVLTLDVELNPTRILQQTEMVREQIAQSLTTGSAFGSQGPFMMGGQPLMGGPFGGMSPQVPAFAPQGFMGNVGAALFPGAYAPPTTSMGLYDQAMTGNRAENVSGWMTNTAISGLETASMLSGAAAGAGAGYMIGGRFGSMGGIMGSIVGALGGGAMAGAAAETLGEPLREAILQEASIAQTLKQTGYRSGLGFFQGAEGSTQALTWAHEASARAADDSRTQMFGLNPRDLVQKLSSFGMKEQLLGSFPEQTEENADSIKQMYLQRMDKLRQSLFDTMQVMHSTSQEAQQILADVRRAGSFTPESRDATIGLIGGAQQFGISPGEMLQASTLGSNYARAYGIPGEVGQRENIQGVYHLAELKRKGMIDPETEAVLGGLPSGMAQIQKMQYSQMAPGGLLDNLVFAATTEEGGVDVNRLRELVNGDLSPLQIRHAAAQRWANSPDQVRRQEEYQFNRPSLHAQINREDPGLMQGATRKMIQDIAQNYARSTGRPVTQATLYNVATQHTGMADQEARLFVQSNWPSTASSDAGGIISQTQGSIATDTEAREADPMVQLTTAMGRFREAYAHKGTDAALKLHTAVAGRVDEMHKRMRARMTEYQEYEKSSTATEEESQKRLKELSASFAKEESEVVLNSIMEQPSSKPEVTLLKELYAIGEAIKRLMESFLQAANIVKTPKAENTGTKNPNEPKTK
jgi:hypothetical protein